MESEPASEADRRRFMARALELAEAGWGRVHPNPLVGAVVVRDGQVVGAGAHREFGGPHAEVEALEAAGEAARGATLYVTLEPCTHHGKTPPCTDAVLESGIARVVFAASDPDPEAGGGGVLLAERGVEVVGGVERERARRQNALFFRPTEAERPFVALKLGLTLDARIARRPGERTTITGPRARAEVHRLRAGFDGLLIGARTARTDDPLLTVREAAPPRVPPTRIVVDPSASLPHDSRLVSTLDEAPVAVAVAPDASSDRTGPLKEAGVRVWETPPGEGGLDVEAVIGRLFEEGYRTVLCEGGGRLGSSLLRAGLVDRLYLFYAPTLLGADAVPAFPGAVGYDGTPVEVRMVGRDIMLVMDRDE